MKTGMTSFSAAVFFVGMFVLISGWLIGCADIPPGNSDGGVVAPASTSHGSLQPSMSHAFVVRSHPAGTFLRDPEGAYWMVTRWQDRSRVTEEEMTRTHLDPSQAIAATAVEMACLPNSGREWRGLQGWELRRIPQGSLWYLERYRRFVRQGMSDVLQSRHEDPEQAQTWDTTTDRMLTDFRDVGPMPLMDGTLVRTDRGWYFTFGGYARRFVDEATVRMAGYDPDQVLRLSENRLWQLVTVINPVLDAASFLRCPAEDPDPARFDDMDGDGVTAETDCNDFDPRQYPGRLETCDGIDNDCDGFYDNGFSVGMACRMDDGCHTHGLTQCEDDWHISCQSDDISCD